MGNLYGKYLLIKTGTSTGTVAITQVEHATISASATSGNEGDKITISITIDTGYKLSNFVINGVNTTSNTFNLKEGENTVTAVVYKTDQLIAPLLSKSSNTYDAYSFYISNQNTTTVYYHIDNFKVATLKSGESKYCEYTWGTSETYASFSVKFSDPNETYSDSESSTVGFIRPEKEITYYTLTLVYSGCDKTNDTYQIEANTTVNPNNYGVAPSGYTIKSRSPSSNFTMLSDTTITITCEEEKVYYTLTIVYSGCSKSNDTYSIEAGTIINPSNYGSAPTGYKVSSRSPSDNFTMNSDATITITCVEETTYYTLTILYSGCSKDSETYQIKSSTTVYPSNYGTAPSGYKVDSRSPSSSFTMTKDTTIVVYCSEDTTVYTLTIRYSGCSKADETHTISSGVTVNPSSYGTAPSGYKITSRSPSSSFTMISNKTITIYCEEDSSTTTYYTLTIYYYYGTTYGFTKTKSIAAGSTVYPSSVAASYIPSGYKAVSYSPDSYINMNSDKELTVYLEVKNYTLFVYIDCNGSIIKSNSYSVENGSTVNPNDYKSEVPSGYTYDSITPSSSFTMNSDKSITIYVNESKTTETVTFTVYVSDICSNNKCTSLVTGSGKSYCDTSATTSGGVDDACCSGTTSLCMTTTGCPYVFSSVSWDSTFTTGGYKYTYVSDTGTGKTYCTATYEKEAV